MSKLIIYLIAIQLVVMNRFDFSDMFKCLNLLLIVTDCNDIIRCVNLITLIVLFALYFTSNKGRILLSRFIKIMNDYK